MADVNTSRREMEMSNNRVDWTLPYTVTEIETYAKPSAWHILVMGLAIPGIFLFLSWHFS